MTRYTRRWCWRMISSKRSAEITSASSVADELKAVVRTVSTCLLSGSQAEAATDTPSYVYGRKPRHKVDASSDFFASSACFAVKSLRPQKGAKKSRKGRKEKHDDPLLGRWPGYHRYRREHLIS